MKNSIKALGMFVCSSFSLHFISTMILICAETKNRSLHLSLFTVTKTFLAVECVSNSLRLQEVVFFLLDPNMPSAKLVENAFAWKTKTMENINMEEWEVIVH